MPKRIQKYLIPRSIEKKPLTKKTLAPSKPPQTFFMRFKALQEKKYKIREGSVSNDEATYITKFIKQHPNIKKIMEIGFNGGLSCASMLAASDDVYIVSFDIGKWDCVLKAKELIAKEFPNRHQLVIGDSTITIPKYDNSQYETFDFIFLDGGHQKPVPQLDIENSLKFLKKGGYVFMDDYCHTYGSEGVIEAYDEAVAKGWIKTFEGPFVGEGKRGWIVAQKC